MKTMKLFCRLLDMTVDNERIILALKGLIILVQRNNQIFGMDQNIRIQFYGCCGKRKTDELMMSKNVEISQLATRLSEFFKENVIDIDVDVDE